MNNKYPRGWSSEQGGEEGASAAVLTFLLFFSFMFKFYFMLEGQQMLRPWEGVGLDRGAKHVSCTSYRAQSLHYRACPLHTQSTVPGP